MDLVLDLVGGETQTRSFAVLKAGGRLVATAQPPVEAEAAKHRVQAVMMEMQPSTQGWRGSASCWMREFSGCVVTRTYPLSQARDAWAEHHSGHARGKVVLEVPE